MEGGGGAPRRAPGGLPGPVTPPSLPPGPGMPGGWPLALSRGGGRTAWLPPMALRPPPEVPRPGGCGCGARCQPPPVAPRAARPARGTRRPLGAQRGHRKVKSRRVQRGRRRGRPGGRWRGRARSTPARSSRTWSSCSRTPLSSSSAPSLFGVFPEGEQPGSAARLGGGRGGRKAGTASGVPREAFQPGDLAFPPDLCPPARAPLFPSSGNTPPEKSFLPFRLSTLGRPAARSAGRVDARSAPTPSAPTSAPGWRARPGAWRALRVVSAASRPIVARIWL